MNALIPAEQFAAFTTQNNFDELNVVSFANTQFFKEEPVTLCDFRRPPFFRKFG
jgi:hypothetical protein